MPCPICGEELRALENPQFGVCPTDRLVVNLGFTPVLYEHDYFDKEYEAQYGKSYTADRQAIIERNENRYAKVQNLFSAQSHPHVLEVGSAAGYFLKAMQDQGFIVRGWEISKTMAAYANGRGLRTTRQDFLTGARAHTKKRAKPYDIVALFYVLEHLPDQKKVWAHLARLVRKGGFLLLALPSSAGPTYRFHKRQWFATHPKDHAVDYSPYSLKRIAERFGFTLKAAFTEGVHPARFPLGKFAPFAALYRFLLQKKPIGDTIFAALEKTAEVP